MIEKSGFCSSLTEIYSKICLRSKLVRKICINPLMTFPNLAFAPYNMASTKQAITPIAWLVLCQKRNPWFNLLEIAPNFINFSLSFKYQNLLLSAKSYTHFLNLEILLVLASFGGRIYIV